MPAQLPAVQGVPSARLPSSDPSGCLRRKTDGSGRENHGVARVYPPAQGVPQRPQDPDKALGHRGDEIRAKQHIQHRMALILIGLPVRGLQDIHRVLLRVLVLRPQAQDVPVIQEIVPHEPPARQDKHHAQNQKALRPEFLPAALSPPVSLQIVTKEDQRSGDQKTIRIIIGKNTDRKADRKLQAGGNGKAVLHSLQKVPQNHGCGHQRHGITIQIGKQERRLGQADRQQREQPLDPGNCKKLLRDRPYVSRIHQAAEDAGQPPHKQQPEGVRSKEHSHAHKQSLQNLRQNRAETIGKAPGIVHDFLLVPCRKLSIFHDILHDAGTHVLVRPLIKGQDPGPCNPDRQDKSIKK